MPFTPFHFGPALALTFIDYKKKRVDLLSALLGAIIVDIRAIYIWFFGSGNFHDGPFHTFLIAPLLGIGIGIIVHLFKNPLSKIMTFLKWPQETSIWQKIISASSMAPLHVLLDAPLYTDIRPLWPFSLDNPFYNLYSSFSAYLICIIGFILCFIELTIYFSMKLLHKNSGHPQDTQI